MSDHLKVVLAALSNVANLVAVAVAVTTRAEVINEMNMLVWGWKEGGQVGYVRRLRDYPVPTAKSLPTIFDRAK